MRFPDGSLSIRRTAMAIAVLAATLHQQAHADDVFAVTSPDFKDGGDIPTAFTCDGAGRSPKLQWSGAPEKTTAFALTVDDPDAPGGSFTHWVVYNIPGAARALDEGVKPAPDLGDGTKQGVNGFGKIGYGGPCPPPGPPHRYVFAFHALAKPIEQSDQESTEAVREAIQKASLAEARLVGRYARPETNAQ
jgi:Raf kinase inhibitor-like YbhB/YbcL family protein